MAKPASTLWRRLRRSLTAGPGRFAGGSAANDLISLLTAENERLWRDDSSPLAAGGERVGEAA